MQLTTTTQFTYSKSYLAIIFYLVCMGLFMTLLNGCDETSSSTSSMNNPLPVQETTAADASNISDNEFKIFDGTNFSPKPQELARSGVDYFVIAKANDMWGKSTGDLKGTTHLPDQKRINEIAHDAAAGPNQVAISIQHWKLKGSDDAKVQKSVNRFLKVINQFKQAEPGLQVGLYRSFPIQKIWKSTKPIDSKGYREWEKMNERLQELVENVDVIYPSLRTFVDDRELWVKDATEQMKMARKLAGNKPVHVVLWPKYHSYYDGYKNRFVEPGFWELQLETARKLADGLIISTSPKVEWDNKAPWWEKTHELLTDMGKVKELTADPVEPVVSDAEFKVFDGTYFRPHPWAMDNYGISDVKIAYPPSLWGKTGRELIGTTSMPDKGKLSKLVRKAAENDIDDFILNIEHWPLDGKPAEVEANMNRFMKLVDWVKQVKPEMNVGFYGGLPVRNFYNATKHTSSGRYQKWVETNMDLKELAKKVDAIYPSLYTFNDDREKWKKEAVRQIELARELNNDVPVYVFLWPQYHPYDEKFAYKFLEYDYWKFQLEVARKYADGIVIYTPRDLKWNNSALWWKATKRFMVSMDKVDWWDEKYGG